MAVAVAAFPITPLLTTCKKITTTIYDVGKKIDRAPLMMTSIATECSLIHVALDQLRSLDWTEIAIHAEGRPEQLTRATQSIILGCTLTVSVIEDYTTEFKDRVEGKALESVELTDVMVQLKDLWKEEEMRELLLQLRGYQTCLTSLLRAAYDPELNDPRKILTGSNSRCFQLLRRSRASRSRKPLCTRPAMQEVTPSIGISPDSHATSPSATALRNSMQITSPATSAAGQASPRRNIDSGFFPAVGEAAVENAASPVSTETRSGMRKRPACLTMKSEDNVVTGDLNLYKSVEKEQMRKSSPTIEDNLCYSPRIPVLATGASKVEEKGGKRLESPRSDSAKLWARISKQKKLSMESLLQPPMSPPPTTPLPELPSPSPLHSPSLMQLTRKEAPPSPSPDDALEAVRNASHEQSVAPLFHDSPTVRAGSPSKEYKLERPPKMPAQPARFSIFPTPVLTGSPARKREPSHSIRDQVLVLPETARHRKLASNERMRKDSINETPPAKKLDDVVPDLLSRPADHPSIGNASEKQGLHRPTQSYSKPFSRMMTTDAVGNAGGKRSTIDGYQTMGRSGDQAKMTIRVRRGLENFSHPMRDGHQQPQLILPSARQSRNNPMSSPSISSAIPAAPGRAGTPAEDEAWPLTPEPDRTIQREFSPRSESLGALKHFKTEDKMTPETPEVSSSAAVRTPTTSDPHAGPTTPRSSLPTTPISSAQTQRSWTTSASKRASGASQASEGTIGDSASIEESLGPSILSTRWYRSQRHRLHRSYRVSGEMPPWEHGATEPGNGSPHAPPISRGEGTSNTWPRRAAPRPPIEGDAGSLHRAPLLPEVFLSDVDHNPAKPKLGDHQSSPASSETTGRPNSSSSASLTPSQTSATNSSPQSSTTSNGILASDQNGRLSTQKQPRFPGIKSPGNAWYTTASYQRLAEEQRRSRERAAEIKARQRDQSQEQAQPSPIGTPTEDDRRPSASTTSSSEKRKDSAIMQPHLSPSPFPSPPVTPSSSTPVRSSGSPLTPLFRTEDTLSPLGLGPVSASSSLNVTPSGSPCVNGFVDTGSPRGNATLNFSGNTIVSANAGGANVSAAKRGVPPALEVKKKKKGGSLASMREFLGGHKSR